MAMVLLSSPFTTIRIFSWTMEVITGDRKKLLNIFLWDVVIHNSPGKTSYDTTMPRIYIWYSVLEVMIMACKTYVDDLQYIAVTQ